jgi:catechol 2,3-dioxygenase-like lactoylglutathione lyase family enzyme
LTDDATQREERTVPISAVLAGIPVNDFDAAVEWYERLLGRPADKRPMDGLAEWHFPRTGTIQVIEDADRAGGGLLTLSVDDLRQQVAELGERGLAPDAVDDTTSEKVLFAQLTDPDGSAITLVEQRRQGP